MWCVTRVGREASAVLDPGSPANGPDVDPFADLFRRTGGAAYRVALAITGDPGVAEDVVQEAFVRVFSRAPGDETSGRALDGYLHRAVRNLALDHLRRRKVATEKAREAAAALLMRRAGDGPSDGPDAAKVSQALFDLPVDQREVVVLRVWEGLSFPEIAERVEVPLGTVHSRFRYAMERLRAAFVAGASGGGA
jgi:RNA polymerase sigma-70 factor (ECF subfamily)